MPLLTRVAVRTALIWLLLALLVRLGRALVLLPEVWRPVEVHLFVVGPFRCGGSGSPAS